MRIVIQRSGKSSVTVGSNVVGQINSGLVLLVCIEKGDTSEVIQKAAKKILTLGPKIVIIKKGEHGALLFNEKEMFFAPAIPLEKVFDPTGAGDTFAGGLVGHLCSTKDYSF